MSVESALQRISTLQQALADPASLLSVARAGGTAAPAAPAQGASEDDPPGTPSFADQLQSARAGYAPTSSGSEVASAGYPLASSSYTPSLSTGTLASGRLGASATSSLGSYAPLGSTSQSGALGA
ncbi:MAG TPA: hypothetical protein VGH21_04530, partial [Solirubrobacteraceae bacterium]